MKIRETSNLCIKKCWEEKLIDSILRKEKIINKINWKGFFLIKEFNTFMYDHMLHCDEIHFCRYCLQAFSTEEILKRHMKDCFKINGKQKIMMSKKDESIKFKIMSEK